MFNTEQLATLRELTVWACGLLSTFFAIGAGAVQGGWLGAFTAAAAGFGAMGGIGAYANRPTTTAPKA